MSNLINKFLEARSLIDRAATQEPAGAKKAERNVMEKPRPNMETVRDLIDSKPTKKAVMEFLKRKVAQYTDDSSDVD
jgi:hypothetical protein